ncbi:two component, sigma54 specific, transcriptional regulator, Fis family [Xanthobacter versatilis]|uniref:Two component, sigma54 specific, transcriptional regulator, Fis family n=1 Tax=Xanthobacter autotrophicus (strain ATCC BAA-1158 / Py2) TaxID=78245 RepID=A7IE40_XANP2|nr:two component, sigma54 specific, transcriptional regulator, Fis family [Xanthobacter autotrophicus Py2]
MAAKILIVDDEVRHGEVLEAALAERGFEATSTNTVAKALTYCTSHAVDLVLSDLRMPGQGGSDLLKALKEQQPELPVIIMTAYATVRGAVDLVKDGAFDYVAKPLDLDDVVATMARALRLKAVESENARLRSELEGRYRFDNLVGDSPAFRDVLRQVTEVAPSRASVLLLGESGTGKELVARAIHYNSPRRDLPFVAVNCAAIPETLIESELFGHVKGAFTGATGAREGRFAAADHGTLFLDEIADMPLPVQAKVLRALQEQSFEPVGSSKSVSVDVRIIAATHKDLQKEIAAGTFRMDLYYRLAVFPISLPPLRERTDDIVLLANHFLAAAARDMGKRIKGLTPEAQAMLTRYRWPGNVRELQNCMERAAIVARGDLVGEGDLLLFEATGDAAAMPHTLDGDLDGELARIEREFVLKALKDNGGVQARAAEKLGITERSLWHRIKKLGIKIDKVAGAGDG